MKVLVDSDVLLDAALSRDPHADDAFALLDALEVRPRSGYVAWHSVSNVYYLVRGPKGKEDTKAYISDLFRFIRVAPASTAAIQRALRLPISDFEDAMQVVCAEACDADVIATRNTKDYRRSPVPPMTPRKVLDQLQPKTGASRGKMPDEQPVCRRNRPPATSG